MLSAVLATLLALALFYVYYNGNIDTQEVNTQSSSSDTSPPKESWSQPPQVSSMDYFSNFFSNLTKFYVRYQGTEYVRITDNFCQAFMLGQIINSTHMLINNTLYRYGVLAYKPMGKDYVVLDKVDLGREIYITHTQPQENITVTGGFGQPIWFKLNVNGESRVYWNTEYPGIVYEEKKLICTHSTIKVNSKTVHIIRLFLVKHGVEGGVGVAGIWLALLAIEDH